jgi:hypothetical protein
MKWMVRIVVALPLLLPSCGRTGTGQVSHLDAGRAWTADAMPDSPSVADVAGPPADGGTARQICGTYRRGPREWPVVELVVDGTSTPRPGAGVGVTGWEVTREALRRVIVDLTPASPAVGLTIYPSRGDCTTSSVTVPAAPINEQSKAALLVAIGGAIPDGPRSPTGALALAVADASKTFANGLTLSPFKTVVWLSAGAPEGTSHCGSAEDLAADLLVQARKDSDNQARTFVLALPGAGPARDLLTEVSDLGCVPTADPDASLPHYCFADCDRGPDSGARIEEALRCVLAGGAFDGDACAVFIGDYPASQCFLALGDLAAQANPDEVTVTMTVGTSPPLVVPQVSCEAAAADGWEWAPDHTAIRLCGPACTQAYGSWDQTVTFRCEE